MSTNLDVQLPADVTTRVPQAVATDPVADCYLTSAPLRPGDRVALISPAGPGSSDSVQRAAQYLEAWGLVVSVGANVAARHPEAEYLAGTDAQRGADLRDAWLDPSNDAVVCLRGGFGSMRLLDGVDWQEMRAGMWRSDGRPKLLTGSSDITALHQAWWHHLGVSTLFSPMPGNNVFRDSEFIRADVHRWLFEPWEGRSLVGPATEVLVPGSAQGRSSGGNLSLVAASVGAPEWQVPRGSVAFLEDVDEEPYRVDNLLIQLQRSGWLGAASGFVLGSWLDCGDLGQIRRIAQEYVGSLGVPVLWEQGFGHNPDALSVPMNVPVVLDAHVSGTITLRVGK